ncbi:ComEC family competence protein [bacterium]|nr:MAG: ComEC family competence protein [bacterium]
MNFWILIITVVLTAVFIFLRFWKKNRRFFWIAALSLFILVGSLYSSAFNENFAGKFVPSGENLNFQGLVVNNPAPQGNYQNLTVETKLGGNKVKILAKAARYPEFRYGDLVLIEGTVKKPEPESYAQYLAKEGISAVVSYPKMSLIVSGKGSPIKSLLFDFKNSVVDSFGKVLPSEESAFLSGLVLGERSDFSKEFKTAMQTSGTTHLVALSGYNVTIIVTYTMVLLAMFFRRKTSLILTFLFLLGFVLMTGAEASVVRAAIMGALVVVANESGRIFNVRNAVMLAGLAMVLVNPKVLVFDAGFELSFLALLGIIYLKPALQKAFHMKEELGILSWRKNLLTTGAAQLMVVPILIQSFGNFSPISLLSNVLILELIPFTMALGFGVALASGVSYHLMLIASWFVWPFLKIETWLIKFFGGFGLLLNLPLSWLLILFYYAILIFFIIYMNRRERKIYVT